MTSAEATRSQPDPQTTVDLDQSFCGNLGFPNPNRLFGAHSLRYGRQRKITKFFECGTRNQRLRIRPRSTPPEVFDGTDLGRASRVP